MLKKCQSVAEVGVVADSVDSVGVVGCCGIDKDFRCRLLHLLFEELQKAAKTAD